VIRNCVMLLAAMVVIVNSWSICSMRRIDPRLKASDYERIQPVAATAVDAIPPARRPPSPSRRSSQQFLAARAAHRSFVAGGALTMVMISAALLSLVWTPWSPTSST